MINKAVLDFFDEHLLSYLSEDCVEVNLLQHLTEDLKWKLLCISPSGEDCDIVDYFDRDFVDDLLCDVARFCVSSEIDYIEDILKTFKNAILNQNSDDYICVLMGEWIVERWDYEGG